jgi:hypothetical protein
VDSKYIVISSSLYSMEAFLSELMATLAKVRKRDTDFQCPMSFRTSNLLPL